MTSMLLNSVILVLQETLEAALLISMLMAISYQFVNRTLWLPLGLLIGLTPVPAIRHADEHYFRVV